MKQGLVKVAAGLAGLLYGIDIGVITAALPYIRSTCGFSDWELSLVVGVVPGGMALASFLGGPLADLVGRRRPIVWAGAAFALSVPVVCLSGGSFPVLIGARILQGASAGVLAIVVPMYLAETLGPESRGRGTGFFQLFLSIGVVCASVIGFLIVRAFGAADDPSVSVGAKTLAWQLNFAWMAAPALVFLFGSFALPESPRWPLAAPKGASGGAKGEPLLQRRFVVPFLLAFVIAACTKATGGGALNSYSVTIFTAAGLAGSLANAGDIALKSSCLLLTVAAVALVDRKGRRWLMTVGTIGMFASLVAVGAVFLALERFGLPASPATGWAVLVSLVLFMAAFAIGPGVCVWLALSELLPTRIRAKGMSVALFVNHFFSTSISSSFLPWVAWGGYAGAFFTFALFALVFLFAVRLMPETKGRTLEEIEAYFARRSRGRGGELH